MTLFLSNTAFAYFCYKILSKTFKTHFKNNMPYTSKQPLTMAYERSESAQDNFGKFIHQFQPELIRKLERVLNKLYRQNLSSLFNQTCLNTHVVYSSIASQLHNNKDRRNDKDARRLLYKYIYLSLYL